MAKQDNGIAGGFRGRLGGMVGYLWNGKWCLRSRPTAVSNPRTDSQMASRALFADEVRLAAAMRWPVTTCLTDLARTEGMTAYNLFVSINQPAFSAVDGRLGVDYAQLQLSLGPVVPVDFGTPSLADGNVLTVSFHNRAGQHGVDGFESVYLYLYCPARQKGHLASPVYRNARSVSVVVPDYFMGCEAHLYGFVRDRQGQFSPTVYVGSLVLEVPPAATPTVSVAATRRAAGRRRAAEAVAEAAVEAPATTGSDGAAEPAGAAPDPMQLTLW